MTAAGEPLTLAHGDELRPLLAAVRQSAAPPPGTLSDATFANLLLFRDAHDWRLLRGRWPCISGHAYDGARLLLPLFDLAAAPVDELRALLQGHDAFGPLDDAQLARLDPALFVASSSRGDADYLYSAEQFRHYRGTLLQKKANLVRQLLARHRVDAEPYAPALADEAAQVLQGWLHDKAKQPGDTDDGPCLQALQQATALGLHGTLFRIHGQAAGFVLAEPLAPGVVVMRFAKALDAFKGLYQHMFQHYAREHADVQWLNFEQDMGLANFRQTKLSYQPAQLLAKHRVTLR
jgi:hypothetical protein